MADTLTTEQRSERMSRVRSKDTKPEILVRKYLFAQGFRYRIHPKELPGKPDIVLPKYRIVLFVHGCFWHQHPNCNQSRIPKSHVEFWVGKFEENKRRDEAVTRKLHDLGWKVFVVHECQLTKAKRTETLRRLSKSIREDSASEFETKQIP